MDERLAHPGVIDLLVGAVLGSGEGRAAARQRDAAVEDAARLFKALGHDGRLSILCHLMSGERSVSELENLLDARQSVVSQHLARLRVDGLVSARREGQAIFYSIRDRRVRDLLSTFRVRSADPRR